MTGLVVVVGRAPVVVVVAGVVGSIGLVVVSVGPVACVAGVVVVAIRATVTAVLEVCGVITEGAEEVVASDNIVVLAAVRGPH